MNTFPMATIRERTSFWSRFPTRLWWVTLMCGLVSAALLWTSWRNNGELIEIAFRDGYGLKPEDRLKHRGIDIGSVEKIEWNKSSDSVLVHVRMTAQTRSLASDGARFWIVRPLVSIDAIEGLDTILGAKYIAIEPSNAPGKTASRFVGLDAPPIPSPPEGALEISLDAPSRGGLESNAPILFRGFRIGSVIQVSLASDARTVQARCAIDPEYRELVRTNSKFWNRSGWRLDVGLTGIKLDADTLSQMLLGGIEMATPGGLNQIVSTGHRFVLYDKPEAEWTAWQPSLAHGQVWNRIAANMPQPIRSALRWQERSFGFRRNQQRSGWCLPLSDGTILTLSEQIAAPNSAIADTAMFEVAGQSVAPNQLTVAGEPFRLEESKSGTSRFSTVEPLPSEVSRWPSTGISSRLPEKVCDFILAHADPASVLVVDASRVSVTNSGWRIDDSVAIDRDYHGIPVVSTETTQVIGLLSIGKDQRVVVGF